MAARPGRVGRRRAVRVAARWLGAYAAFVVAASSLFILLFTPAPKAVNLAPLDAAETRRVYVLAWGYHSSIFVERPAEWRVGPEGDEDARFVEYGWGDRRFMMESNFMPHSIFASAVLPTATVVYVCGHERPPDEEVVGGRVFVRDCSAEEVTRLVTVLESQMDRRDDGSRLAAFPPVAGYPGRFYPGREYYVVWWNCNMWTMRMLKDAGLDASPSWVFGTWQIGPGLRGFRDARG